jgi:hypothetical protein
MQVLRALRVALGGSARGWPPQVTPDRCIAEISVHLEDNIVHSRVYGQQLSLHLQEAAVVQPAAAAGQTPATVMECLPEAAMQSISMAVMHTKAGWQSSLAVATQPAVAVVPFLAATAGMQPRERDVSPQSNGCSAQASDDASVSIDTPP